MATKNFISEQIESVIATLSHHPEIVVDELLINPATSEDDLAQEVNIPHILKEFYRESNGLVLRWHAKDDPVVRGGIVMPLLENIHNTRWTRFGMLDYTDDVHIAYLKSDTRDSSIIMESLEGDEDIEFVELREPLIDIKSYFQAFGKSLGFRFWQENYRPYIDYSVETIIANRGYLYGVGEVAEVALHSAHVPM